MPDSSRAGGVVFRVGEDVFFLPASVALKLLPVPDVARVPGSSEHLAGVALVEGELIPVARVGAGDSGRGRAMLVCTYLGERLGLVGVEVLATGRFDGSGAESVAFAEGDARLFDLGAVVGRMREVGWAV